MLRIKDRLKSYSDSFPDVVLFTAMSIFPVYLWESGGMQVSHYLFLLFAGFVFFCQRERRLEKIDVVFLVFIIYTWVREVVGALQGLPYRTLLTPAHITYSFIIFKAIRFYIVQAKNLGFLSAGLVISLFVALAGVFLEGVHFFNDGDFYRSTGMFNNPNQLGYFSILAASIGLFLYIVKALSWWQFLVVFVVALFLTVVSLSKAAIISMVVVVSYIAVEAFKKYLKLAPKYKLLAAVSTMAVSGLLFFSISESFGKQYSFSNLKIYKRFMGVSGEKDSTWSARGYHILLESSTPELVFGVSCEEAKRRNGNEIHSTFMSMLTYYGVGGGGMLLLFFGLLVRDVMSRYGIWSTACLLLPAALYGLTHNGMRATLFWVLLALASASLVEKNGDQQNMKPYRALPEGSRLRLEDAIHG